MHYQAKVVTLLIIAVALVLDAGCKKKRTGPDLSTPKAAALTFTTALEEGDVTTARRASNASGMERDLIQAMAQSASGMKRLSAVAIAKFGAEASSKVLQQQSMNVSKNLANADVDAGIDRATVRSKDGRDTLQLQRINGQWRVDIGALIRGKDISNVIPFFHAAGLSAREVADEIEAGRCGSIEAARDDMTRRIMTNLPRFVREQYEASTRPTVDLPGL